MYVDAYRKAGDPHAVLGASFRLSGLRNGASTVRAIRIIRRHCNSGLAETRRQVERVLEGESANFEAGSIEAAAAAVAELREFGFDAEHLYESRAA